VYDTGESLDRSQTKTVNARIFVFVRSWSVNGTSGLETFSRPKFDRWRLQAKGVIGVIGTRERAHYIGSKIPLNHVLLLASLGGTFPSQAAEEIGISAGKDLLELVVNWFLSETEHLLSWQLYEHYAETEVVGQTWAGVLDLMHVSMRYYEGVLEPKVTVDTLSPDLPVNRVIKAALEELRQTLASTPYCGQGLAAGRLLEQFERVGDLRPGDRDLQPPRKMENYRTAWTFAGHILDHLSRDLDVGDTASFCFLLPTAEFVEAGLRNIFKDSLRGLATDSNDPTRAHAVAGSEGA
jgi:5-methylcytosine-specific restriction enzyme subunit McrC